MAILMFVSLKGGVAKTTSAAAIAECLAERSAPNEKVLLIDADHQCAAGELLLGEDRLIELDKRKKTLHDLMCWMLKDGFDEHLIPPYVAGHASDIAGCRDRLSVIPCSIRIDAFHRKMAAARQWHPSTSDFLALFRKNRGIMERWLQTNYAHTIIDCPPSIAPQVQAFLTIADAFVVPSIPDRLSVWGASYLIDRLRRLNVRLPGLGVLWTLYRQQLLVHNQTIADFVPGGPRARDLPRPFATVMPNAAAIAAPVPNASTFARKFGIFAPRSQGLCDEILDRCGQLRGPSRSTASNGSALRAS